MTLHHVVVEGPDGAGKTTLIQRILDAMPIKLHDRFSTSVGGPMDSLAQRVSDDISTLFNPDPPYLYDRHPIISEPIYGPVIRGKVPESFRSFSWTLARRGEVAHNCLVVLCLPSLGLVRDNVARNDQMPGVVEHIDEIWSRYNAMMWPGAMVRYNYASSNVDAILTTIRRVVGV